ncbi:hypothetical protein PV755_09800 [Streptomyces caniscabiei]|nr:hypothetical protein [Streptomyces caniscabiei]MDX3509215.1 hypothetical protein [Streptomyces caniscabiei]MDX3717032.1 hypothetical protein [Streptomyces caniscabiei]
MLGIMAHRPYPNRDRALKMIRRRRPLLGEPVGTYRLSTRRRIVSARG